MDHFSVMLVNGVSYGLLLFMLSSGLTLIFSMMGVLNFAHASFYMLGAYAAYTLSARIGFWPALLVAPLLVGAAGALFETAVLRRVHQRGPVAELLATFGLAYIVAQVVQLAWGRGPVDYRIPTVLDGVIVHVFGAALPAYRLFIMGLALAVLAALYLGLRLSRTGLVIRAALTHPAMTGALGYNVPRLLTLVFGTGAALAGLAGAVGGNLLVTEPGMAATVGSVVFVTVVVGGLGSPVGALLASLLIGVLQNWAVTVDASIASLATRWGHALTPAVPGYPLWQLSVGQIAPVLPYLLMVAVLLIRPRGLLGTRDG